MPSAFGLFNQIQQPLVSNHLDRGKLINCDLKGLSGDDGIISVGRDPAKKTAEGIILKLNYPGSDFDARISRLHFQIYYDGKFPFVRVLSCNGVDASWSSDPNKFGDEENVHYMHFEEGRSFGLVNNMTIELAAPVLQPYDLNSFYLLWDKISNKVELNSYELHNFGLLNALVHRVYNNYQTGFHLDSVRVLVTNPDKDNPYCWQFLFL